MKVTKWITKEQLYNLYVNQNLTQRQIAVQFNVTSSTVVWNMKKWRISARKPHELIRCERKCSGCGVKYLTYSYNSLYCNRACRTKAAYYTDHDKRLRLKRECEDRTKRRFFDLYGIVCVCCGENTYELLSLDHVHNDGKEKRLTEGHAGMGAYRIALKDFRPDLFQVLCMSCNWGKGRHGGICPHKMKKDSSGK